MEESVIAKKYAFINFALDERMKRLFAASEAKVIGYGGVSLVSRATGISRRAIHAGQREIEQQFSAKVFGNIRKKGGGRKKSAEKYLGLKQALQDLIDPATRGDPESPLLWTNKSLRTLAQELKACGYNISYPVVGQLLKDMGYSLQANSKTLE